MKHLREGVKKHFGRHIFSRRTLLSLTLRITLLVFISLSTIVLVVYAIAKQLDKPVLPDPFTIFANVLPGQTIDTRKLEAQGYLCHESLLPSPADISQDCTRSLPIGMFSQINLTIWDGIIKWLDLQVHDNDLCVGDLSLQWGSPEIHVEGIWMNVRWSNLHVTGLGFSYNGQFTYFQALSHITFATA